MYVLVEKFKNSFLACKEFKVTCTDHYNNIHMFLVISCYKTKAERTFAYITPLQGFPRLCQWNPTKDYQIILNYVREDIINFLCSPNYIETSHQYNLKCSLRRRMKLIRKCTRVCVINFIDSKLCNILYNGIVKNNDLSKTISYGCSSRNVIQLYLQNPF